METPEESSVAIKSPCALYSKVAQDPSEPSIRAIYPASLRVSMIFAPFEPERPVSNPFAYVHDEKDILKLVTTLIANTKGEGKSGDEFWEKAEKLLYSVLIGYIHYEAPEEEQNFSTLLEMINAMEVREDDL